MAPDDVTRRLDQQVIELGRQGWTLMRREPTRVVRVRQRPEPVARRSGLRWWRRDVQPTTDILLVTLSPEGEIVIDRR